MKIKTWLPVYNIESFQFDYDYILQDINDIREENGLKPINDIELKINYIDFDNNIARQACEGIGQELSDYVLSIDLEYIDKKGNVNCIIEPKENEIKSFIYENKVKFEKYLKDNYTSYDGFFSHYDNDFESWQEDTKDFSDFSCNGHYLGSILQFIAYVLKIDESLIYDSIEQNELEYIENYNDLITSHDLIFLLRENNILLNTCEYIVLCYENKTLQGSIFDNEKINTIIKEYELNLIEA